MKIPLSRSSAIIIFLSLLAALPSTTARAASAKTTSGSVKTADGIKIHYIAAGPLHFEMRIQISDKPMGEAPLAAEYGLPILFIPGWTMPGWIWDKQIQFFARTRRVVAMDPRCQGESTQANDGLSPAARARDIKAVVDQLHLAPVVLVGWSMAVGEITSYIDQFGTHDIAAVVFVDDAPGADVPAETYKGLFRFMNDFVTDRRAATAPFVRSWFKKPQPEEYLNRVIEASLRTPTNTAVALLVGKFGTDNRAALAKIDKPALIVGAKSPYDHIVRDMQKLIPGSQLEIFEDAGHALFVGDADRFNSLLDIFLTKLK